jgi:hypothetical protein
MPALSLLRHREGHLVVDELLDALCPKFFDERRIRERGMRRYDHDRAASAQQLEARRHLLGSQRSIPEKIIIPLACRNDVFGFWASLLQNR